jgi:hypothetical protein
VAIVLLIAGCTRNNAPSDAHTPDIPIVTPTSAYGPFPYDNPSQRGAFEAFSDCAREHGLEYRGPFADSNGEGIYISLAPGEKASRSDQERVGRECPQLDVAMFGTPIGRMNMGRFEESALAFAQCIRENGVRSYPDPSFADGRPADSFWLLPFNWSSDRFTAAVRVCVELLRHYLFGATP